MWAGGWFCFGVRRASRGGADRRPPAGDGRRYGTSGWRPGWTATHSRRLDRDQAGPPHTVKTESGPDRHRDRDRDRRGPHRVKKSESLGMTLDRPKPSHGTGSNCHVGNYVSEADGTRFRNEKS